MILIFPEIANPFAKLIPIRKPVYEPGPDEIEEAKTLGEQAKEDLRKVAEAQGNYGSYASYTPVSQDNSTSDGSSSSDSSDDDIPFVTGGYGEELAFYNYPWNNCRVISDGRCPWGERYYSFRYPFLHRADGSVRHRLVKF